MSRVDFLGAKLPPIIEEWQLKDSWSPSEQTRFCEYCRQSHTGYLHHKECGHLCYGVNCRDSDPTRCQTCWHKGYVGTKTHCEHCNSVHYGVLRVKWPCGHLAWGSCVHHYAKYCKTCAKKREMEEERERQERLETCDDCGDEVRQVTMRYCTFCGGKQCGRASCFDLVTCACNTCLAKQTESKSMAAVEEDDPDVPKAVIKHHKRKPAREDDDDDEDQEHLKRHKPSDD